MQPGPVLRTPSTAVSGPTEPGPPAAVVFRPRKARWVSGVLAPLVVVFFVVLGTLLSGSTGAGAGVFQRSDRVAMVVLGLLVAAGILLFARPVVTADRTRVRIKNMIGGYDLPWSVVRSVRFERGSPWASLELEDDDVVAVMAIQATDKAYAVDGVQVLRSLLAASRGDRALHARGGGPAGA